MKAVAPVRAALGVRTIFNILGPLANPAQPPLHVIGAYSRDVAELMAHTLAGLNIERTFVIHGADGWDEPTPIGPFMLFDVRPGQRGRVDARPCGVRLQGVRRAATLRAGTLSTMHAPCAPCSPATIAARIGIACCSARRWRSKWRAW